MKIDGLEFEGMAQVGSATTVIAQLGWMNARYDEFIDPRTDLDPSLANLHDHVPFSPDFTGRLAVQQRSEEHTSELQSLMRISYAVFCLNKKKYNDRHHQN